MTLLSSNLRFVLAFAVTASVLGCASALGGDTSTSSSACDHRPAEAVCTDYKSVASGQSAFKDGCQRGKATVIASCAHDTSLGGCNQKNTDAQNNEQTDWYFADATIKTTDDVKAKCGASIYVAP